MPTFQKYTIVKILTIDSWNLWYKGTTFRGIKSRTAKNVSYLSIIIRYQRAYYDMKDYLPFFHFQRTTTLHANPLNFFKL